MIEDKIKELLQDADRMAGFPPPISVNLLAAVRRRAHHRRFLNLAVPLAAAAVVLIAAGLWSLAIRTAETRGEKEKIALLETQLKQLQARTDAALNLIQDVLEKEQKRHSLDELEAQLASIPDPLEEIQKEVDKTAFILVYQADRLYRELNRTDSAVETYNRVIELFPKNRWAQVARQRISEIENRKYNKRDWGPAERESPKGELKWKPPNTFLSC